MPKEIDILLIAVNSPIKVGLYENGKLIKTIKSDKKSSDILAVIYRDIFKEYSVKAFYFVNGPGSFMAIKVAYIFLKSLSILHKVPLFASDAFKFNNNKPIKAIGKLCFVKIATEIRTQKLETVPEAIFMLPDVLDYNEFSTNTAPLYMIGAVG
ncbi:hypothetical protein [Sulfurimonas sp.]|jgi:tRNA A37 threonylcarbamoyladenosine modification protein TsaB|uniref:hypothetical protein n=1 Tax=Sulfurimonas sp. TaxID=2022749 RepID=UPI0025F9FD98|nr:hypothetical protein [Sulfurimonas sp.]MBT5934336.1 hypothetical protein [Sulfurimonas sp.]